MKMALAMTFTCGGTADLARFSPYVERERRLRARIEVRDAEVVNRERETQQSRAENGRSKQRERHLLERPPLVRAEIHRSLLQVAVEADEARLNGDDDVAG